MLTIPNSLKYQMEEEPRFKISDQCCYRMKKLPVKEWQKTSGKTITITGMRSAEGGMRTQIGCILTDKNGKLKKFHPLVKVDDNWEKWFIETKNIQLCELYYPPYNFERTGCKGCPFALGIEEQLEVMDRLLPNEKQQCEIIWKPVYAEYRRIGYRLKKVEQIKLF